MHESEHMMEGRQQAATRQERGQAHTRRSSSYKATNMTFEEMVEMVAILKKEDYDGKRGPYKNPNKMKAQIMEKVRRTLHAKFGVQRSREQLRKRWCDLKIREQDQMGRIRRVLRRRK